MGPPRRRPDAALIETLRDAPESFTFYQAVRTLERLGAVAAREAQAPPRHPVGGDSDPREEAVLLRAMLELTFPSTEVASLADDGARAALDVTLMGLNGPSGVLPSYYSELLLQAQRDRNPAMRDFFDIFNHRALSLFVRAMEKYRIPMAFERSSQDYSDTISRTLYSLVGLGEPSLRRRQAAPDTVLAFYGGHYSRLNRNAGALGQLLAEYFELPAKVIQFQGRWGRLKPQEVTRIGAGSFSQLGVDAVCGSMVFDAQAAFRVRLGPLDYDQFLSFMPNTARMAELKALAHTYAGPTFSFDVQLALRADQIPLLRLSPQAPKAARLGWNAWLPTSKQSADAYDAVFEGDTQ